MKAKENRLSMPMNQALAFVAITTAVFLGLVGSAAWQYVQCNAEQDLLVTKNHTIITQQALINSLTATSKGAKQTLTAEHEMLTKTIRAQTHELESQRQMIEKLQLQSSYKNKQLKMKDKNIKDLRSSFQRELNTSIAEQQKILLAEQAGLAIIRDQLKLESARLQKQKSQVIARMGDVEEWEKKKAEFDIRYANEAKEAIHVTRVDDLMNQFDRLQVDLDVMNECDKTYLYRYNEAKSILNHIRTYIQSNKMKDDYYFYVISNDSLITAKNRKLCLDS